MADMMTRFMNGTEAAPPPISLPTDLVQRYLEADRKLFISRTFTDEEWDEYYSPHMIVETEGKIIPCAKYKKELRYFKTIFKETTVKYDSLIQNGRMVASYQNPRSIDHQGNKMGAECIIIVEFGAIGTEDENRIIYFRECMRALQPHEV